MVIIQQRSRTKASGGAKRAARGKRLYESGSLPTLTKLANPNARVIRTRGGNMKQKLLSTNKVNLYNPQTKTYMQASIKTITENPANRHFVRRNIITRGCVVETDQGKARVTSRPGQSGMVNAVLISA
ncbi:30S ribosomal protein S8e [Candidatus Woesearchaeota archaeon]|nr:30S ribosomal protein S8e [Candidatus Woesearchaeota archaeon]